MKHPVQAFPHPLGLTALAAATALLVACGGGDDHNEATAPPQASALKLGDQYTVAVQVGDQAPSSESFRVYGITEQLDVVSSDNGKLIPGSLFALPDAGDAKEARAGAPSMDEIAAHIRDVQERLREIMRAQDEINRRIFHNIGIKSADADAHLAVVRELADLDTDLPTVVADLSRSGLTPLEYVEFYDTLDVAPGFAAQDDAEGQLISFFQTVQDEAEQGYSCGNVNPDCRPSRHRKAAVADDGSATPTAAYVPNQKDFLAALAAQRLSWKDFLAHMNARGHDFAQLLLAFHDWAVATSPATDATLFPAFIAAYLAGDVGKTATTVQPKNAAGAGAVMQGVGSLLSLAWDIVKNSRPVVDAESTQNFVLSQQDADPMHYAGATKDKTDTVTVKFTSPGVTWAETQFRLDGYYNATHKTLAGRWMPQLNFEVFQASAKPSISLKVRANVTSVVNVGTHDAPLPETEVRVDITQGSLFQSKLKKVWFRAHGAEGFSIVDKK